ncbi:MAG: hypothetical protein J1E65_08765 [Lachnospiraceae bacterium]|nr:hypothetical protein [Lachnospiraceae bacterium]
MGENEVMNLLPEQVPYVAIRDSEGNYTYGYIRGYQGWNGTAYPRSYMGMDSNWEYR